VIETICRIFWAYKCAEECWELVSNSWHHILSNNSFWKSTLLVDVDYIVPLHYKGVGIVLEFKVASLNVLWKI
jgi:hypothetical protein